MSLRSKEATLYYYCICVFVDDSNVKGDPLFIVPLSGEPGTPSLCYEVYGVSDKNFNVFSESCVSVNAHYTSVPTSGRDLHLINKFGVRVLSNKLSPNDGCANDDILVELVNGDCHVLLNGEIMKEGVYKRNGVHVGVFKKNVFLSVENCQKGRIGLSFVSKSILKEKKRLAFLEVQVEGGLGITTSAHGLIGMFIMVSECVYDGNWITSVCDGQGVPVVLKPFTGHYHHTHLCIHYRQWCVYCLL